MNEILANPELSLAEKVVMMAFVVAPDSSATDVSKFISMPRPTVTNSANSLLERGYLRVSGYRIARGKSKLYALNMPALPA
jgi:DNA-binding MarR family transcriptional regulator